VNNTESKLSKNINQVSSKKTKIKKTSPYKKKVAKTNLTGFLFASPWIIGFLLFSLYPIIKSLYYSFTDFNVFMPPKWVGLANYKELFSDDLFYKSLKNTLFMTLIGTPINLIVGLINAMLLNVKVKGMPIFRTLFFIPSIVPVVASSMLWTWLFNPSCGLINKALGKIGLYQPNWLADPRYTKPALIIMGIWGTGSIMIIFLAALQDIPAQLYEAADIDGAGPWDKFIHVTLPGLAPIMLYQIILSVINNFQYFTQAYVMTGAGSGQYSGVIGGPENSMLFYALYLYHNGFNYLKMGKASAMAWILFIIVAIVTWILIKTSHLWVSYGEGDDNN